MTESGEQNPAPAPSGRPRPPMRRGRRGGRGRGRGPIRQRQPPMTSETPALVGQGVPAAESVPEALPLVERVARLASRVASGPAQRDSSAITQAIDEVTDIIEQLKRVVEHMDEVLELVELAERQKIGDEREIEALRRQLRHLHRPPERQRREGEYREEGGT